MYVDIDDDVDVQFLMFSVDRVSLKMRTCSQGLTCINKGKIKQNKSNQFITRRRVVWPHLTLFQGCGTRQSRVLAKPETLVNETTLPILER